MSTPDKNYITEALLPCPFCGGEASRSVGSHNNGEPWPYIECVECACSADPDVWNRRAFDASRIAESERMRCAEAARLRAAIDSFTCAYREKYWADGKRGVRNNAPMRSEVGELMLALSPTPQSQAAEPTERPNDAGGFIEEDFHGEDFGSHD